jgi:hypothetical protein
VTNLGGRAWLASQSVLWVCCCGTLWVSAAAAQSVYGRADTLRYHESSETINTMAGSGGEFAATNSSEAVVALAFGSDDSAEAWFESMDLRSTSPRGTFQPNARPLLGQRFHLRFDANGRVETLATPEFPESFTAVTDLSTQFDDFFLVLPDDPLALGLAWSDTVTRYDSTATDNWSQYRSVWELVVARDTVVNGVGAVVVEAQQTVSTTAVGPVEGEDLMMHSTLSGEERSVFVFAPSLGKMLSRDRTGRLMGTMEMTNAARSVRLSHSYQYTGAIRALN